MEKLIEEEGKKYSRIHWFIVVIVIPALFALAVGMVVATVAGVNVFEKAKEYSEKIPFISSEEQVIDEQTIEEMESKLTSLRAEIKDREAAIDELQTSLDSKDKEIEKLQLEKEQLQKQMDDLIAMQEESKRAFKDIVDTYEKMSAKKAAPAITAMNDDEAVKILSSLKSETLAAILEKMNSDDAAKYTTLLSNNSSTDTGQE